MPAGGTPCLKHGKAVAGVVRAVGKGSAWLLGTYVGHSGTAYRDAQTPQAVRAILAKCGIEPVGRGKLLLRRRVAGDREAWIFTNPTRAAVTESVDVAGWGTVEDLLGARLTRRGRTVAVTVDSLDVKILIASR